MNREQLIKIIADQLETDVETWAPDEIKNFGPTTRSIPIFGEISTKRSLAVISQIDHLTALAPERSITIYLNTPGGAISEALAIYDTMVTVSCPVVVYALGTCASAGLIILSGGDHRVAAPNTTFFYHQTQVEGASVRSSKEMESLTKLYGHYQELADRIIFERSDMSKRRWKLSFQDKTSFYFDSKEALKYGVIDKVLESSKLDFQIVDCETDIEVEIEEE